MPTTSTIKYLSVDLTIGGYNLVLETDSNDQQIIDLNSGVSVKEQIGNALGNRVAFRMEKGKKITINLDDFVKWIEEKILEITNDSSKLKTFFTENKMAGGISVTFWDAAFGAKRIKTGATFSTQWDFSVCMKLELAKQFYTDVFGTNADTILEIIDVNSLGFGMFFSKNEAIN